MPLTKSHHCDLSLIETNIAIIVGCMPALPQFATVTIGGSAFFKSLRSWLLRSSRQSAKSKSGGNGDMGDQGKMPSLVTFGAKQMPRRNNYFELTDTVPSQSNTMLKAPAEDQHEMHSKPSSTHREAEQGV